MVGGRRSGNTGAREDVTPVLQQFPCRARCGGFRAGSGCSPPHPQASAGAGARIQCEKGVKSLFVNNLSLLDQSTAVTCPASHPPAHTSAAPPPPATALGR